MTTVSSLFLSLSEQSWSFLSAEKTGPFSGPESVTWSRDAGNIPNGNGFSQLDNGDDASWWAIWPVLPDELDVLKGGNGREP